MSARNLLVIAIVALGLQACMGLGHRSVVENRYKTKADGVIADDKDPLSFTVAVATVAPPAAKSAAVPFTSLSDRAQAAYIRELKGRAPPVEIKGDDGARDERVGFQSSMKRRFVVSVRPIAAFLPPGDRLESVGIWLRVDGAHKDFWRITNWSQASNATETIELGTIQRTETSKLTASSGLEATSGSIIETKVGLERSAQNQETAKATDETKLYAGIEGGVAYLRQRGAARRDLTGNYEIDTTLSVVDDNYDPVTTARASKLMVDDAVSGKPREALAGEVDLKRHTLYSARLPREPVCGKATLGYRVRSVAKGAATLSEADDEAVYKVGWAYADFVVSPPTVSPRYGLEIADAFLHFTVKDKPEALVFGTLQEAEAFSDWLSRNNPVDGQLRNTSIGLIDPLKKSVRPLTSIEAKRLMAKLENQEEMALAQAALAKGCPTPPTP